MKKALLGLLLLNLIGCTLSATQEQRLNYQLGLYLKAQREKSLLATVSYTHPSYVKYVRSKGNEYFKQTFAFNEQEDDVLYIDPKIEAMESEGDCIQVLYSVDKEFILHGENSRLSKQFVAISDDDGLHWFFLNYQAYQNKNICRDIKRLLK